MKNWRIVLTVICVSSFVIGGLLLAYGYTCDLTAESYNLEYTFALSDIEKIDIGGFADAQVNVIPVPGDEIRVDVSGVLRGNQKPFIAEQRGSQLVVSQGVRLFNLNLRFWDTKTVINVCVDPDYGKDLHVNAVARDINIGGLSLNKLSVNSVSGGIFLRGVNCSVANIDTVSGNVSARGLNSARTVTNTVSGGVELRGFNGEFKGSSVSGSIDVEYEAFDNNVNIDTVSGRIVLTLSGAADFALNTDTVSGRLVNEFVRPLLGSGRNKINLDTVSGNMTIKK